VFDGADEQEIEAELSRAWLADHAWDESLPGVEVAQRARVPEEELDDDAEARLMYISAWLEGKGYDWSNSR